MLRSIGWIRRGLVPLGQCAELLSARHAAHPVGVVLIDGRRVEGSAPARRGSTTADMQLVGRALREGVAVALVAT